MVVIYVIIVLLFGALSYILGKTAAEIPATEARKRYEDKEQELRVQELTTQAYWDADIRKIGQLEAELKKIKSQKKSSEVRTGQIAEQMAPFLGGFPYHPKRASFLGNPIDFVVFDDEGVHFVEVKSGKSQLNSTQRRIRDQVREGSVTFEVYRIKGE